jgi:RimJ/RimL family protein N-acetyltransferase
MRAILETPRLVLREMWLGDLDFIAALLADPEVMRFYPRCYSREEAAAWVRRQIVRYEEHGHGFWLVAEKESGEPVGQVGLILQQVEEVAEPEIGYLIHRPFWRRGFASEAAAATRDYAFGPLGKSRVISLIRPENIPSQGVARKIGLQAEERLVPFAGLMHLVFSRMKD